MPTPRVLFIPDRKNGFELVVSAGDRAGFPLHNHVSTHTVGLIRRGTVRLKRSGVGELLRAGDLFVIPPYEPHSLEAAAPYEMLNLCIDKAVVASPRPAPLRSVRSGLDRLARRGLLSRHEASRLKNALRRLSPGGFFEPDPLDRLRETMESHPDEAFDLDAMARAAHMDKFHLIRKFRQRYGLTPHRFHAQNRVRKAKRTCAGSSSLTQAALASGFYDQSHCIREFRRHLGLTPRQYRESVREADEE